MKKSLLTLFLATAITHFGFAQIPPPAAAYNFSGNANDEIGIINGTVHGATLTQDRFGNPNSAYKFTNGQYITLPDAPVLKSPVMSVSMWIRVDGYNPSTSPFSQNWFYSILNSATNSCFGSFTMSYDNSSDVFLSVSENDCNHYVHNFSTTEVSNQWQHYVLIINNDSIKTYINNQPQLASYKSFITTFTSDSVFIGASGNTTYAGFLNGCVDDIRIYNSVLTSANVDSLFHEQPPASTSINDVSSDKKATTIYPNPTKGIIHFSNQVNASTLDLEGRIINSWTDVEAINIQGYPSGIYYLILRDKQGNIVQRDKIVKY